MLKTKLYIYEDFSEIEAITYSSNKKQKSIKKNKYTDEEYTTYKCKYIKRKIKYIERIVKQNNIFKQFITLTFSDQDKFKNYKNALYEFQKFIKRIQYKFKDFSYIAVFELTNNNVYHIHFITNLSLEKYNPYDNRYNLSLPELVPGNTDYWGDFWKLGFINVQNITNLNINNLIKYLVKYFTKSLLVSEKYKRLLHMSKNLKLKYYILKTRQFYNMLKTNFFKILNYYKNEFYTFFRLIYNSDFVLFQTVFLNTS